MLCSWQFKSGLYLQSLEKLRLLYRTSLLMRDLRFMSLDVNPRRIISCEEIFRYHKNGDVVPVIQSFPAIIIILRTLATHLVPPQGQLFHTPKSFSASDNAWCLGVHALPSRFVPRVCVQICVCKVCALLAPVLLFPFLCTVNCVS
jgi:hypothetical protein